MVEDLDEDDPKFTLDQNQKRHRLNSVDSISYGDRVMWNHIATSTLTLLKGCRTLIYPLLALSIIVSLLTHTTGEANYKTPWTDVSQHVPGRKDFIPLVKSTIEKEQPFCVWFGFDFDTDQPSEELCELVQDIAGEYITDGRLVILDSRWQQHITPLEDLEDPLTSDYDGFNWSSYYGSNSGNVLTQCEDLAKYLQNQTYPASRYNQGTFHHETKEKIERL